MQTSECPAIRTWEPSCRLADPAFDVCSVSHWGVVIALRDARCLPTCIAGTSAGAAVAAVVCTRTDGELEGVLDSNVLVDFVHLFNDPHSVSWRRGHLADPSDWLERVQAVCNHATLPDLTFEEAFRHSGRELSVTVSARRRHEPPLLLNRIVAPDVTIASAVLASVAMPFLFPAQELTYKDGAGVLHRWSMADGGRTRWRDGSIAGDTPRMKLAQQFCVAYCVVSQVQPALQHHATPLQHHFNTTSTPRRLTRTSTVAIPRDHRPAGHGSHASMGAGTAGGAGLFCQPGSRGSFLRQRSISTAFTRCSCYHRLWTRTFRG